MYRTKPQGWRKHLDFILLDILCLNMGLALAYFTRLKMSSVASRDAYFTLALVYTLMDILILVVNGTFSGILKRGRYKEFAKTAEHVLLLEMAGAFFLFSVKGGATYSRIIIYLLGAYYLVLSYIVRSVWKRILRKRGYFAKSGALYIIATEAQALSTVTTLQKNAKGAYAYQGICILDRDCIGETIADVSVNANRDNLLEFLCDKWIDEIYIAAPDTYPGLSDLIGALAEMGMVVHVEMEDFGNSGWRKQVIETIGGRTVRTVSVSIASTKQAILKRALDILGGLVGCFLTLILTIIIGPMIYIKSPGPIFFAQTRVGKNGKKFKMYKFRSMYLDAEARKAELMKENRVQDGMMFKLEFDPRIIGCEKQADGTIKKGIGNFIRDYSIDEFPQFFNVLKGDLSLVGTRPPTVDEWEKYKFHHRARLAIKPGITGLWQVSGRSNITDFEEVVALDKKYIREWSMGLDLRILVKTVKVVLGKEGSM